MTEDEVNERLRAAIAAAGSQRAFAEKHGFTPAYISDVLRGQRGLSDRILAAIGVEQHIVYRPIDSALDSRLNKVAMDDRSRKP